MKTLFIIPPRVSFDRTLHYRYHDFGGTIEFARKNNQNLDISVLDGSIGGLLERNLLSLFSENQYQRIIFFSEVADGPESNRLAKMIKMVSPKSKIAIYGDATLFIPHYFQNDFFDCIHISGDHEATINGFLKIKNFSALKTSQIPGALVLHKGIYRKTRGVRIHPNEWGYPALDLLPLERYKAIDKTLKGIPFELSVYAARGCARKCFYCPAPRREGTEDRRRNPEELINWIQEAIKNYGFEFVHLHAANFAFDTEWLFSFCKLASQLKKKFVWSCTCYIRNLTEEKIGKMAEAGCERIGVGVETISLNGQSPKGSIEEMKELTRFANKSGLRIKGYVMAGYPNQTNEDLVFAVKTITDLGWVPRVTGYTPLHELSKLNQKELDRLLPPLEYWDRKSFMLPDSKIDPVIFYRLITRRKEDIAQILKERSLSKDKV